MDRDTGGEQWKPATPVCRYYTGHRRGGHQPDCEKQAKGVVDHCLDSTGVDGTESCQGGARR